uniref:Response regulatory domain-containing protein n=1 Tax=Setaria italica TaxID=4555 RepID=K3YYP7_SETIT
MATPHILLVDDSCVDRLVASRLLRSCNIRVTAMEGPKQALKFLYMILTDYCMPEITGYDLLVELKIGSFMKKKSPRFNHLPVVIACTEDILERIKKCLDGGAKDYVIKPIKVVNVPYLLSYI